MAEALQENLINLAEKENGQETDGKAKLAVRLTRRQTKGDLEDTPDAAQTEITDLQTRLKKQEEDNKKLKQKLTNEKTKSNKLEDDLDHEKQRNIALEGELNIVKAQAKTHIDECDKEKAKVWALTTDLKTVKTRLTDVTNKHDAAKCDECDNEKDKALLANADLGDMKIKFQDVSKELYDEKIKTTDNLDKIAELIGEKTSVEFALDTVQTLLKEKEEENEKLYVKVDTLEQQTNAQPDVTQYKPKILLMTNEQIGMAISDHIDNDEMDIIWKVTTDITTADELREAANDKEVIKSFQEYDELISMLGTDDIISNTRSGTQVFNDMIRAITLMNEKTKITVKMAQIPPMSGQYAIEQGAFNRRVASSTVNTIPCVLINSVLGGLIKAKLLESDHHSLTEYGIKSCVEALTKLTDKPTTDKKVRNRESVVADEDEDDEDEEDEEEEDGITELYEFHEDYAGSVIGKAGSTIRPIQEETETYIYLTYWSYYENVKHGAVIVGARNGIKVAKERIQSVVDKATKYNHEDQSSSNHSVNIKRNGPKVNVVRNTGSGSNSSADTDTTSTGATRFLAKIAATKSNGDKSARAKILGSKRVNMKRSTGMAPPTKMAKKNKLNK
jgi:hypothetical protein